MLATSFRITGIGRALVSVVARIRAETRSSDALFNICTRISVFAGAALDFRRLTAFPRETVIFSTTIAIIAFRRRADAATRNAGIRFGALISVVTVADAGAMHAALNRVAGVGGAGVVVVAVFDLWNACPFAVTPLAQRAGIVIVARHIDPRLHFLRRKGADVVYAHGIARADGSRVAIVGTCTASRHNRIGCNGCRLFLVAATTDGGNNGGHYGPIL